MLQIDALAFSDLQRAMKRGYCPTNFPRLLERDGFRLRRWFADYRRTPYCQGRNIPGENAAFRVQVLRQGCRKIITLQCAARRAVHPRPHQVAGALAGGSVTSISWMATRDGRIHCRNREKMSVYQRLGGGRMLMLILLHPVRLVRMLVQRCSNIFAKEGERLPVSWRGESLTQKGSFRYFAFSAT